VNKEGGTMRLRRTEDGYRCADARLRIVRRAAGRRWALLVRERPRAGWVRAEHPTRADAVRAALGWIAEHPEKGGPLSALKDRLAGLPGVGPLCAALVAGDLTARAPLHDLAEEHERRFEGDVWWAAWEYLAGELGTLPRALPDDHPHWRMVASTYAWEAYENNMRSRRGVYTLGRRDRRGAEVFVFYTSLGRRPPRLFKGQQAHGGITGRGGRRRPLIRTFRAAGPPSRPGGGSGRPPWPACRSCALLFK
jgi:hypothetical protein